jgi:hypothetical protein
MARYAHQVSLGIDVALVGTAVREVDAAGLADAEVTKAIHAGVGRDR